MFMPAMTEGVNWPDEPVQGEPAATVYRRLQAATKMAEWLAQGSSQAR